MNIVNKLTLRHLKQNMRRSIVTVIGIIVSVAMITAVAVSSCSGSKFMVEMVKFSDGNWIAQYTNTQFKNFDSINKDETTAGAYITTDAGSAKIGDKDFDEKTRLSIRNVDEEYFKNQRCKLIKGSYPKNADEIVVTDYFLSKSDVDWLVGQKVKIDFGTRDFEGQAIGQWKWCNEGETFTKNSEKTYKLVGIVDAGSNRDYNAFTYLDKSTLTPSSTVDIISTADKLSMSTYSHIQEVAKSINCENYKIHSDLLRYSGFIDDPALALSIYGIIGILLIIIIIASVALIYNAFAISINERSKYLGMLSSVGATRKQKRASVYFEGAILGAIGIPIGIISGILGIAITFKAINPMLQNMLNGDNTNIEMKIFVPLLAIVFCVVLSVLTILISAYIPGKRASKTTAIDAIRQTNEINVKPKHLKTSKITRKIFGYEGELALKNLKRNRKKFRVITTSLAISVILFLSVNSFTDLMMKSFELSSQNTSYDISVTLPLSDKNKFEEQLKTYSKIDKQSFFTENVLFANLEKAQINPKYFDIPYTEDVQKNFPMMIVALDDEVFNKYCDDNKISNDSFYNDSKPTAVLENYARISYYDENDSRKMTEMSPIKIEINSDISLSTNNDEGEYEQYKSIQIGAIINKKVLDIYGNLYPKLVMPLSKYSDFIKDNNSLNNMATFYINSESSKELANEIDDYVDSLDNSSMYNIHDYASVVEANRSLMSIMKVFVYGFIALITLISVANIFNTISTGITLRRREFAMIKSVGMTPKSFKKMLSLESVFYGLKALLIGIPISLCVYVLMFMSLSKSFGFSILSMFNWQAYIIAIVAVFIIVAIALIYSVSKIKNDNIIETLKNEDN